MPVKTNTTGKKKKKVVHADAARDIRKALPSWKQAFPALGPSPLAPGSRGPGWAIRFSSPEVQQSITAHLISFPADTACFLPLIKKINKGIGHIRFTSIIAHVVLITVIKSYLPQISGWKCHDPQLKTHCKFYIFQLHSFSSFTKKSGKAIFLCLIGLEVSLIAIYQKKMHFVISWNTLKEVHFPFVFKMNDCLFL